MAAYSTDPCRLTVKSPPFIAPPGTKQMHRYPRDERKWDISCEEAGERREEKGMLSSKEYQ